MHKIKFLTLVFTALSFLPTIVIAQDDDELRLRQSTKERGLQELLDAIDTHDKGNGDIVALRGMLPSGSEPHSVFLQVASDERVRKIYSLLKAMPQAKAGKIVSESYQSSLSKLKALSNKGSGDYSLLYGLHAKLWLSYEFEKRKDFNRRFNKWNDWYVDRLSNEKYLKVNKHLPPPIRKFTFEGSSAPEMLFYLNLVLIDQVKNKTAGDESEFAQLLQKASPHALHGPLSRAYGMFPVLPFEVELTPEKSKGVEPLTSLPLFMGWQGLDVLDIEQRAALISKARLILDKKGTIESAIDSFVLSLLTLGGAVDLDGLLAKLKDIKKAKPLNGATVAFLGSSLEKPLISGWYAEIPPTKKQLLKVVDRFIQMTPRDERDVWKERVEELKKWLSQIP